MTKKVEEIKATILDKLKMAIEIIKESSELADRIVDNPTYFELLKFVIRMINREMRTVIHRESEYRPSHELKTLRDMVQAKRMRKILDEMERPPFPYDSPLVMTLMNKFLDANKYVTKEELQQFGTEIINTFKNTFKEMQEKSK